MDELPVVLVVEDDELVQTFVEDALSDAGFEPAVAASGEEAVILLKGNKDKYRALVTDISLKGKMDGWEVAQHAREIEPEFPIVYMSGAAAADWTSKGVPNSIMLEKPFALALQLPFCFEVGTLSGGLVSSAPERPCDDVGGLDPLSGESDGDAADFLD